MKDIKKAITHLREHQDYPATKMELLATCDELSDFSEEDKNWFEKNLPDGKYESADEVIATLGWQQLAAQAIS